jgi:hypothetical protein
MAPAALCAAAFVTLVIREVVYDMRELTEALPIHAAATRVKQLRLMPSIRSGRHDRQ